jgi:hypothetical protein
MGSSESVGAGQHPHLVAQQAAVGRIVNVGLDHSGVDAHPPEFGEADRRSRRRSPPNGRRDPFGDAFAADHPNVYRPVSSGPLTVMPANISDGGGLVSEITAITKYLADADGGSRRILRSRPDCLTSISS